MSPSRSLNWPKNDRSMHLSSSRGTDLVIRRIVPVAYLLAGVLVASQHGYLANLGTLGRGLSAVLALVLWPMVLLGVHLSMA